MSFSNGRHPEIEELISASLHGDLTAEERRRLDAHLDGCATCRDTLASFAEQRRIMAGLRHVPPPRDLGARVRAGIESGAATRHWWQRPPAIFAGVAGSLAVVAGALLALVLLDTPANDPEVGRTSPTPSVAVATPSPAEETLAPLETPAPATPVPTLPPASIAPDATPEPVPSAVPAQETPEPEIFLAVASPSADEAAMTLRASDTAEGGEPAPTTLTAVEAPEETPPSETGVPIAAELSPDGQWLAYIVDLGLSGFTEVRATHLGVPSDDPEASPPIESEVAVGTTLTLARSVSGSPFVEHLFWSADGARLAFTAVDREGGGTDAWIFDAASGQASALTDTGTAYAGSWAVAEDGTPLLWVSTAAESPESHLLAVSGGPDGVIEPVDPVEVARATANVFQPIVSPNGALVIYWAGRMQQQDGGEWAFTDGGAPWLAENRPDEEQGAPFSSAREVFRDVTIRQNAFTSAAIRWAPDSDAYVIWDAAWAGETQDPENQYPDVTRVYLTRASDPRGMTSAHAIDTADVPEGSTVVDVKVAGTGRHLAITARKPTPGDLAAPEAELFLVTRNTGDVADERETLGSEPEVWFGPAVFTPEQWAELIGE